MSGGWSRSRGTLIVRERSSCCEVCGCYPSHSFSHRIATSRGGTWAPSNGVRACGSGTTGCHGWLEDHPTWAGDGGWHIRRDRRHPVDVPVFIVTPVAPLGGWHLLMDDGSRELVDAEGYNLPEVPVHLPPGHVRVRALGGRPLETVPWVKPGTISMQREEDQ